MVKRIAERSRAVIVHNPAAAATVRQHHAAANVIEIPHLVIPIHARMPQKPNICAHRSGRGCTSASSDISASPSACCRCCGCSLDCLDARTVGGAHGRPAIFAAHALPYLSAPNVQRIGFLSPEAYWKARHGR
jgi:hypothetical protein